MFAEKVHQIAPGLWAFSPGVGVANRVDEGHDAVADESHGQEVLGAFGVEEHGA